MECYKEKPTVTNKITFYLYHIPGKKIGVTRDLNNRVTKIQGYRPGEYEVLDQSEDIDYISNREIELQQSYGYKVDRTKYKNLFNKMRINATENTSTFGVPLNKLKGNLMDNLGRSWETTFGTFTINKESIDWILKNANRSQFGDDKCYIYNKPFIDQMGEIVEVDPIMQDRFYLIRSWAVEKGIYTSGDSKTQYVKLMEEAGELAKALLNRDEPEIIDAIGDMVVVLTNLAKLEGLDIEDCIDSAYNVIKSRQGEMVNGTFVKRESL